MAESDHLASACQWTRGNAAVVGCVDRIIDGEVSGWALNPASPNEPVIVTVVANGRAVASALAAYHRDDVAREFGTRGYHGFYVNLRQCSPSVGRALIDVRAGDGWRLSNSPLAASIPQDSGSGRPAVIFMHIPKTAGTAFREAVESAFSASETLYLYPHDNFYPADLSIWRLPLDHRARLRFIMGHFPFGIHEALPQACEYISLVRLPFDRLVSQYYHHLRHSPDLISGGTGVMRLSEVLAEPPNIGFDNMMVRYFSGLDENLWPVGAVNRGAFEMALNNLREHFAYVGIQENAACAYRALASRYSWQGPELQFSNVGHYSLEPSERGAAEEIALQSQQWDIRLYNEIARLFQHKPAIPAADLATAAEQLPI